MLRGLSQGSLPKPRRHGKRHGSVLALSATEVPNRSSRDTQRAHLQGTGEPAEPTPDVTARPLFAPTDLPAAHCPKLASHRSQTRRKTPCPDGLSKEARQAHRGPVQALLLQRAHRCPLRGSQINNEEKPTAGGTLEGQEQHAASGHAALRPKRVRPPIPRRATGRPRPSVADRALRCFQLDSQRKA